jgi:hypothetical protein
LNILRRCSFTIYGEEKYFRINFVVLCGFFAVLCVTTGKSAIPQSFAKKQEGSQSNNNIAN